MDYEEIEETKRLTTNNKNQQLKTSHERTGALAAKLHRTFKDLDEHLDEHSPFVIPKDRRGRGSSKHIL